jgi:hypothetical protein
MTRVCRPAGAAALLLCVLAAAPLGLSNAASREAMADAMVRMMDAMGFLDPGPGSGFPGGSSWAPAFGSFAMPGSIPGGAPYQDPSRRLDMGEAMRQFARGMAGPGGGQSFPWMGSPLDGVWEGRGGELLIVQGNRFRIYAGSAAHVDGYIMVRTNRVALYNPVDSNAQLYEYAQSHGRLALRDASGQLYLYRRLRLDAPAEANWASPSPPER